MRGIEPVPALEFPKALGATPLPYPDEHGAALKSADVHALNVFARLCFSEGKQSILLAGVISGEVILRRGWPGAWGSRCPLCFVQQSSTAESRARSPDRFDQTVPQ